MALEGARECALKEGIAVVVDSEVASGKLDEGGRESQLPCQTVFQPVRDFCGLSRLLRSGALS